MAASTKLYVGAGKNVHPLIYLFYPTIPKTPNAHQKFPTWLTFHASHLGCTFAPNVINSLCNGHVSVLIVANCARGKGIEKRLVEPVQNELAERDCLLLLTADVRE
jgi:hypothetical protein